jgi:hypothetical protein
MQEDVKQSQLALESNLREAQQKAKTPGTHRAEVAYQYVLAQTPSTRFPCHGR